MRRLSFLVVGLTTLAFASPAFAWDFTCSPKQTKDLTDQTPNVMVMLDRSGSMDDADGIIANTCKVCENTDGYFEVASAADCPTTGTAWSVTDSDEIATPAPDYGFAFTMATGGPVDHDMKLTVSVRGDFNSACEYADVYADGTLIGQIANGPDCGDAAQDFTFIVPAADGADGSVDIQIQTVGDNNDCNGTAGPGNCGLTSTCDGVDACGTTAPENSVVVTLSHEVDTYHGTQTWSDPCGQSDKWQQATSAINAITQQSDAANPQYANFGLGLFHDTTANVEVDCAPTNNVPIMSKLNGTGPGGSTPTAKAIQRSYNSSCVNPPATITRTQSGDVGTDASNNGWDLGFNFTNVPTEDIVVEVKVDGDFGLTCEFAAVYVDGVFFEYLGTQECGQSTAVFTVPGTFATDGELDIVVDTRGAGDVTASPMPACTAATDGTQAYCSGANGAEVSISHSNNSPAPGATILINDGQPTKTLSGTTDDAAAADEAMVQACAHRAIAPLFVVGLGAGTHQDFNNVLAAAGGTGSCAGGADPCDDPTNWESLAGAAWDSGAGTGDNDGDCTGAIQASSRDELLTALQDITAQLVCTFNVNFFNSGYTSVPPDPTNDYDYLYVEVYDTNTASYQQIMHKDAATASPAGEGWDFTNESRAYIQFTDYYCNNVQSFQYSEGSTQLACLCQEMPGDGCSVPDNVALGVCPEGVWTCVEGIDVCEPETDCCEDGVPCDTGLEGICAEGVIVCDGPPLGTCVQVNPAETEICDLLDNDCDGETDEELGGTACTYPGGIGRCGDGLEECIGGNLVCVPFAAQPELCNGLDDDCDNEVDNISESWSKGAFSSIKSSLSSDGEAAACRFNDVCTCPNGPASANLGTTFDEYLAAYSPPVCECGEGLSPTSDTDGPMSGGEPSSTSSSTDAAAACSTTGGASGGLASLLVIALAALRRRR